MATFNLTPEHEFIVDCVSEKVDTVSKEELIEFFIETGIACLIGSKNDFFDMNEIRETVNKHREGGRIALILKNAHDAGE